MKHSMVFLLILACICLLASCACEHEWLHATGGHGQFCDRCGTYQNLDEPCHFPNWETPDCENPRRCISCGTLEAEPKSHIWSDPSPNESKPICCIECGKVKPNENQ